VRVRVTSLRHLRHHTEASLTFIMYIALVFALVAACHARPSEDPAWAAYKSEYEKVYKTPEEEAQRYAAWQKNLEDAKTHNAEFSNTYTIGMNQFSDMSDEEFSSTMLPGLNVPMEEYKGPVFQSTNRTLADSVDWIIKGYVTPIKNQGHCGSCYAFAATGSLEGQWFATRGELPTLSEQQIVDCSRRYGNLACNGGWYTSAWDYIKAAGGSDSEDSYPYKGTPGHCRFDRAGVAAECHGYVEIEKNDENALKEAVAQVGPIAVAIEVSGRFPRYTGGVYYNSGCHNDLWHLNHAVLVVGYGSEDGQDYWVVKNSWGARWGLAGYIKMARNRGNNCGIACKAAYPQV